ncbi:MAG TPA: transketolase family protein [Desulfosporosinus sp.]|nr:transketolase family protein [Desulfosporosinus sp.]
MSILLSEKRMPEKELMRDEYTKTLIDIAQDNENIVALDADLVKAIGMSPFFNAFPHRSFDVGIQEANLIGVAAGLSSTGKIPFAHTFAAFASRRAFDQIFLSAGYAKLNIRIIGTDPGITAEFNGGTHMAMEDMGILRTIPGITLIEPVDSVMLKNVLKQIVDPYGVFYIRLFRKNAIKVYEEGSNFEIGKAVELRPGSDVTIIASGIMVSEALKAAEELEKEGILARVVNIFTLKPIDKEAVIKCAEETGAIVTAENHNIINCLGSAVAEILGENYPVPMERVGVDDVFGEVGPIDYLHERFGLTWQAIANKAKLVIDRKTKGQRQLSSNQIQSH